MILTKQRIQSGIKFTGRTILLSTLICTPLVAGQVYKWTDSEGNIHFSDKKPNYQESESLKIKSGKSSSGNDNPQERIKQIEDDRAKDLEEKAQKLQANQAAKEREENCQIVKNNLQTLNNNPRVRVEENGELRYLTPEEMQQKKDKLQKELSENCSGS